MFLQVVAVQAAKRNSPWPWVTLQISLGLNIIGMVKSRHFNVETLHINSLNGLCGTRALCWKSVYVSGLCVWADVSCCCSVSRLERGTETRRLRTCTKSHLLDCCRKSDLCPSQRNPTVQQHSPTHTNHPQACVGSWERRGWSLFFHGTLQSAHIRWIKKWLTHVNCCKCTEKVCGNVSFVGFYHCNAYLNAPTGFFFVFFWDLHAADCIFLLTSRVSTEGDKVVEVPRCGLQVPAAAVYPADWRFFSRSRFIISHLCLLQMATWLRL